MTRVPGKAHKEEQEQFKQKFPALVEEAVKTRDPKDGRPVLKMAQDEACCGRINMVKRSWIPKRVVRYFCS